MKLTEIEKLGYNVTELGGIAFISGFGVKVSISVKDSEELNKFIDPEAHAERVQQFKFGPPPVVPVPSEQEKLLGALGDALRDKTIPLEDRIQNAANILSPEIGPPMLSDSSPILT